LIEPKLYNNALTFRRITVKKIVIFSKAPERSYHLVRLLNGLFSDCQINVVSLDVEEPEPDPYGFSSGYFMPEEARDK